MNSNKDSTFGKFGSDSNGGAKEVTSNVGMSTYKSEAQSDEKNEETLKKYSNAKAISSDAFKSKT